MCVSCRGAGQEVGRSCIMLEFKNKKIMVCHTLPYTHTLEHFEAKGGHTCADVGFAMSPFDFLHAPIAPHWKVLWS